MRALFSRQHRIFFTPHPGMITIDRLGADTTDAGVTEYTGGPRHTLVQMPVEPGIGDEGACTGDRVAHAVPERRLHVLAMNESSDADHGY